MDKSSNKEINTRSDTNINNSNIRKTNNNNQIQIINDLILKKSSLVSKFIGDMSLDEVKNIIEKEYNDVKTDINQLNCQIDNHHEDIKKLKALIKSLQMEKETILLREKSILDNELKRIDNKNKEQVEHHNFILNQCHQSLQDLLNTERALEKIITEKETYIKTFKYNRAKLRTLHIQKINKQHDEHKQRQILKTELEYQLLTLQGQLNEVQTNINTYELERHNINKDYYNWKNEIQITKDIILSLQKEVKSWIILNNLNTSGIEITEDTVLDKDTVILLINAIQTTLFSDNTTNLNSHLDKDYNINKLNRLPQLLSILDNLETDTRKDTSSRYARLEVNHKKNIKRKTKFLKIINKFNNELQKTNLFKKVKVNAPELTGDDVEFDSAKLTIQKTKVELVETRNNIKLISNTIKTLDTNFNIQDTELLSESLQQDNERALLRWEKIQNRCENKYDTQCNSLAEDIAILFKHITDLTVKVKNRESRWTNIHNNPGIILEEFHNMNVNCNNRLKHTNLSNTVKDNAKYVSDIKSDIMEIINMKKTISRIQSNR